MSIASVYTFTSTVITTDIFIKSFRETLIIYTYRKNTCVNSCRGNHTRISRICASWAVLRVNNFRFRYICISKTFNSTDLYRARISAIPSKRLSFVYAQALNRLIHRYTTAYFRCKTIWLPCISLMEEGHPNSVNESGSLYKISA